MKSIVSLTVTLLFLLSLFGFDVVRGQDLPQINAAALQSGSFMVRTPPSYNPTDLMSGSVGDFTPEALFDLSSKLWCSAEGAEFPHVFVLELTEPFMIEKLAFNNRCEEYAGICARDVRVEFADDLSHPVYRSVGEFRVPEGEEKFFPITPAAARLIRISILSNYGHESYTELAEFGAIGSPVTPEIRPVKVAGEWQTNWGPLRFRQEGTSLSGDYDYRDGRILYGGINRNQITYKWVEESVGLEGWTLLFLNREGTRLTGVWCHNADWRSYGFWIMERKEGIPFAPITERNDPGPGLSDQPRGVSEKVVEQMEQSLNGQGELVLYGINFVAGSATITNESFNVLDHLARLLEKTPDMRIRIEAHTDDMGNEKANRELSLSRAAAVRDYLIKGHGIGAERITAEGKGGESPIASNNTEAGKAANRRVEIHLAR